MIPEDPMINQAALSAIDIEKPAGAPKDAEGVPLASAPEVDRKGKTIMPETELNEQAPAKPDENDATVSDMPPLHVNVAAPESQASSNISEVPAAPLPSKDIETSEKSTPDEADKHSFSTLSDDAEIVDDEESKQKIKIDQRQEELEALISAGTYHVPIGQVAKRRGRIVFGIILIVLLLLVAVDLSLDMGLLSSNVLPHTNFLH